MAEYWKQLNTARVILLLLQDVQLILIAVLKTDVLKVIPYIEQIITKRFTYLMKGKPLVT